MAMKIKKYVADTMPEALRLVKSDLGPQAVILNTRTLQKGRTFGLGKKGQIEVTAAVDSGKPSVPRPAGARTSKKAPPRPQIAEQKPSEIKPVAQKVVERERPVSPGNVQWADRISRQIEGLQAALASGSPGQGSPSFLPGAMGPLSKQMDNAGLYRPLSEDLLKSILLDPGESGLKDLKPIREKAARMLVERFPEPNPIRLTEGVRSVIAFVGPAGAGKTTAAARIASHFSTESSAKVAFVAADTDRVGGLEQLRAYAGILGAPIDTVYSPDEMGDAIRARKDVDLVLVDTAGVGPLDVDQIDALRALLREAGPNEIHLTLSVTTDLQQMRDVLAAYKVVEMDRLLLTKLDETARLGAACTVAIESELPLSYTTHGRKVPGDLSPGDSKALVRALFTRRANGAG